MSWEAEVLEDLYGAKAESHRTKTLYKSYINYKS